jgi:broad specificity phosphatase PhoE
MAPVRGRSYPVCTAGRPAATYAPDALVSSAEPKALETAHLVAQRMHTSVQVVDGLQEHDRSNTPWPGPEEFDRVVAAFFHRPAELVLGCETAQQASEHFAKTMADVTSQYAEQNVVVFTPGTVLTLFVARATGMEPLALWKRLGLPSFVVLRSHRRGSEEWSSGACRTGTV